jgi:hypothetical protein
MAKKSRQNWAFLFKQQFVIGLKFTTKNLSNIPFLPEFKKAKILSINLKKSVNLIAAHRG